MSKKLQDIPLASYIVFSIVIILIYSIVEFIFSITSGVSHETLTTCVYAFFGTEIASSCLIKIMKLKYESEDTDNDE
jgi:uncharacterized protein with PQ loop repeat